MGGLALVLGLLTVTGAIELWHVCIFAFVFGSAAAFDAPVRQTFAHEDLISLRNHRSSWPFLFLRLLSRRTR